MWDKILNSWQAVRTWLINVLVGILIRYLMQLVFFLASLFTNQQKCIIKSYNQFMTSMKNDLNGIRVVHMSSDWKPVSPTQIGGHRTQDQNNNKIANENTARSQITRFTTLSDRAQCLRSYRSYSHNYVGYVYYYYLGANGHLKLCLKMLKATYLPYFIVGTTFNRDMELVEKMVPKLKRSDWEIISSNLYSDHSMILDIGYWIGSCTLLFFTFLYLKARYITFCMGYRFFRMLLSVQKSIVNRLTGALQENQ